MEVPREMPHVGLSLDPKVSRWGDTGTGLQAFRHRTLHTAATAWASFYRSIGFRGLTDWAKHPRGQMRLYRVFTCAFMADSARRFSSEWRASRPDPSAAYQNH